MNRQKLIDKYIDAIDFVSKHNTKGEWQPDNQVALDMIIANTVGGRDYLVPENFDYDAFREDYQAYLDNLV